MSSPAPRRRATHAGSWYSSSPAKLDSQLTGWLEDVDPSAIPAAGEVAVLSPSQPSEDSAAKSAARSAAQSAAPVTLPVEGCRAIIGPHAGYSYSGPAAAWAYRCIPTTATGTATVSGRRIKRVFMLGPSHHHYLDRCALSRCSAYETPLGDLEVDARVSREIMDGAQGLGRKGDWEWMERGVDEAEHSIEMHAAYVRKVFEGQDITIVPILVGAISTKQESYYGSLLAPYLADPENFFVVSSDFCHWGSRFSYTYYRPSPSGPSTSLSSNFRQREGEAPIHQSIRDLDDEGMQAISFPSSSSASSSVSTPQQQQQQQQGEGKTAPQAKEDFAAYLKKTRNTVCGRHPIGVLLGALAELESQRGQRSEVRFVRYEQSSECETYRDSSVSYASAFVRFL